MWWMFNQLQYDDDKMFVYKSACLFLFCTEGSMVYRELLCLRQMVSYALLFLLKY